MNFSKYFLILVLLFSASHNNAVVKQIGGVALAYCSLKEAWYVLRNPGVDDNYIAGRQAIENSDLLASEKQNALDNYDLLVSLKSLGYDLIKFFGCVYIAKKGIDLTGLK